VKVKELGTNMLVKNIFALADAMLAHEQSETEAGEV